MLRVLVLLVLISAAPAWGQSLEPGVTASQLDSAVENINTSLASDDPLRTSLLEYYAEAREALASYEQYKHSFQKFAQARENAVKEADSILAKLEKSQNDSAQVDLDLATISLVELEQLIRVDKADMDARKGRLADIRAAIHAMPGRPAEIRSRVTEVIGLLSELDSQLGLMSENVQGGSEEEARLWLTRTQLVSATAEKETLEEELLSHPMRLDLLKAQLDQTSFEITRLERRAVVMAQRAGELRHGEASQAREEAEREVAEAEGKHELVQQLADRNARLTQSFSERSDAIEQVHAQELVVKAHAEKLETDLSSIVNKLEILGMSAAVGEILRERQAQLPAARETSKNVAANTEQISMSSLRQVDLEDERRQLRDTSEFIATLVKDIDPETASLIDADLHDLVRSRRELMRQATALENTYAQALGDYDFTLRRDALVVKEYSDFISERMLWIPSRDTFSVLRGPEIFKQFQEVFAPDRWFRVLQAVPAELMAQPKISVLLMMVFGFIYFSPRLIKQLASTGKFVGYVRSDQFSTTLYAMGLTVLLSLKWPLLLLAVAQLFELQEADSKLATALYTVSLRVAGYLWMLEFLRIALLPNGLAHKHFRWPTRLVDVLRGRIVKLEGMFLPSAFLVGLFLNLYPRSVGGPLGALAVIFVLISIAEFFRKMPDFVKGKVQSILRNDKSRQNPIWGKLLRGMLFWMPVASILAVFLGYTYTALELALMLIESFTLLGAILMFHELGLRGLRLAQRRMTFKVRQEQAKASSEESETTVEDELREHDPDLLSNEGAKLLNATSVFAGIIGVALIWAEIFPALGFLDSVELWHRAGVEDGQNVLLPITLADLFRALILATAGWVALRRIPSLLEILLRQRANVSPASAYAVTRVLQYAATTLLVIFVMGALGGSWSSMQWAVAALSLGIGFGLQEIVANFISGLIILFEQPIRLGDTVTVGEISGTVTKIQMRATTIRDFDRRELLVPNKEFITNQLLNWSLSDPVTRRKIQVGVAYGTDMDVAMKIAGDVIKGHNLVLADPEPVTTFDEFGDNSLLISLRYFIEQLDQRLKVDSELRLEINRRFNAEGIEVAFPQRDIHVDAKEPLEIRMVTGESERKDEQPSLGAGVKSDG